MDAQIRVAGGTDGDLNALHDWLNSEDEFRGRVGLAEGVIGESELGSLSEVLTVAFSAGGAGSVLAVSLITWLKTRQTTAKITVESEGRSVTFDITTTHDVRPLVERVLRSSDDD